MSIAVQERTRLIVQHDRELSLGLRFCILYLQGVFQRITGLFIFHTTRNWSFIDLIINFR